MRNLEIVRNRFFSLKLKINWANKKSEKGDLCWSHCLNWHQKHGFKKKIIRYVCLVSKIVGVSQQNFKTFENEKKNFECYEILKNHPNCVNFDWFTFALRYSWSNENLAGQRKTVEFWLALPPMHVYVSHDIVFYCPTASYMPYICQKVQQDE